MRFMRMTFFLRLCQHEIKHSNPISSVTKTLCPKTLHLVLFVNFSVVSAMSPFIVEALNT